VPDDGFQLQAEIRRIYYTVEVLSTELFIHNTQTQLDVLPQDFAEYI
jgi:hypothetical protein